MCLVLCLFVVFLCLWCSFAFVFTGGLIVLWFEFLLLCYLVDVCLGGVVGLVFGG